MKNIMFVVPSLMRGGAETQAIDLINEVNNDLFQKHVCLLSNKLDQKDKLDTDKVSLIIFVRKKFFDFEIAKKIAKYIDENSIDVVHCTLQISLLYVYMALRYTKLRPKIIVAIHTTKNVSLKNELIDRVLYRYLMRKSNNIVFVCYAQKDYWINKYPEMEPKSTVVYNGVDVNRYAVSSYSEKVTEIKGALGIPMSAKVVINIAGFRPEKGHLILLESFSKLDEDVHLILAGDGVLRQDIEEKVNSLNISSRVHLPGNVSDVRPYLAISDLSVLSSTAVETFSIAMLESMSMGVPMIATDIGGLREAIIEGQTGGLVAAHDIKGLTYKLEKYLSNEERLKYMKMCARSNVVDKFTKEKMAHETERLFN